MSQIETIGTALFGQSWMAQVASVLTNEKGQELSRQTVQSWHNRDNVPAWAKAELKSIAAKRKNEVNAMYELLNPENAQAAKQKAIDLFLSWNADKINAETVIYTRLRYCVDEYNNPILNADVTLEPQSGDGWRTTTFSSKKFTRELINLRKTLLTKLDFNLAVFDETLN